MGADYGSFDSFYPRECVLTVADCDFVILRFNQNRQETMASFRISTFIFTL